jgi:hypothetical protein
VPHELGWDVADIKGCGVAEDDHQAHRHEDDQAESAAIAPDLQELFLDQGGQALPAR